CLLPCPCPSGQAGFRAGFLNFKYNPASAINKAINCYIKADYDLYVIGKYELMTSALGCEEYLG
ncbi:MAG: hypothetical protein GXO86_13780, partial [Chlorobi bacterium]|nr:hypothetical protein [Chlorobiota bacterium]